MLYQLLKRDPGWMQAPYWALVAAAIYPFAARSVGGAALFASMAGFGALYHAQQRATRFEAALPIPASTVVLAKWAAALTMLWLPIMAGAASIQIFRPSLSASAVAVLGMGALYSAALAAMQSVRVRDLATPRWLLFVILIPVPSGGVALMQYGAAMSVAPLSLAVAALLFWNAWRRTPASFQFAPAAPASARSNTVSATGVAWRPLAHSILHRSPAFMLLFLFFQAMAGQWLFLGFWLLIVWIGARVGCRWLWSLPIRPRALLATMLAPTFVCLVSGYVAGFAFRMGAAARTGGLRLQLIAAGLMLAEALLVVLLCSLYDWPRLELLPKWLRLAPAVLLIGLTAVVPLLFMIAAPPPWTLVKLQNEALLVASRWLPASVPAAATALVALIAALWWTAGTIFSPPLGRQQPAGSQSLE